MAISYVANSKSSEPKSTNTIDKIKNKTIVYLQNKHRSSFEDDQPPPLSKEVTLG